MSLGQLAGHGDAEALQVLQQRAAAGDKEAANILRSIGKQGGGPIAGPGTIGKDSVLLLGAPGEHIWTASEVDAAGGHAAVHGLRSMATAGMFKNIGGYQHGGEVDPGSSGGGNLANLYAYAASLVGTPYSQNLRNDCSGMVSKLVNVALGLPPAASFTTHNEQAWLLSHGFKMGAGPPGTLRVGWDNWGPGADDGHTAATLPDGRNAEAGGAHGSFLLGAGAKGAGSFGMQAYLPMNPQGTAISGSGGLAGGGAGAGGGGLFGGGGGGGGEGGSLESQGQQLGQGMVTGALQVLGLDGSVFKSFTGKGPLDWGATKLGMGVLKWGLGQAGIGGDQAAGGGGGIPGLGGLGALISSSASPAAGGGGGSVTNNHFHDAVSGLTVIQNGVTGNGVNDFQNAANSGAANRYGALAAGMAAAANTGSG